MILQYRDCFIFPNHRISGGQDKAFVFDKYAYVRDCMQMMAKSTHVVSRKYSLPITLANADCEKLAKMNADHFKSMGK